MPKNLIRNMALAGVGAALMAAPAFSQGAAPADAPKAPPHYKAQTPPTPEEQKRMADMKARLEKVLADARAKPTPRTADGKPDLSGMWDRPIGQGWTSTKENGSVVFNFPEYGPGGKQPIPADHPKYKGDGFKKVEYNDEHSSFVDKTFACGLPGVPRIGPPQQVVQSAKTVALLYNDVAGEVFRAIPTDGTGFRPDADATMNGDSVGHWEGDTLVIDSKNFTDDTWLSGRGYFHSDKMTVRETLKREGDLLIWTATVTDPETMLEPWTTSRPSIATNIRLEEPQPCMDIVRDHLVNNDNHS